MSIQTSNEVSFVTTTMASPDISPSRQRMIQNYSLIWFDTDIDETNKDCQNTLEQLRNIINDVAIFTERNEFVDYLTKLEDRKAFLILGNTIGQQIMPLIHDIPQVDNIYVFCVSTSPHNKWIKEWAKVKSVHTTIMPICAALRVAVELYNENSIIMSFIPISGNDSRQTLNQLDASFMYTQIFKEILLEMEHDGKSIRDFITFCRSGDYGSPSNIDRFEKEYDKNSAIWWYTSPSFIYSMLNSALRTLEADIIIKMGFFICDLHHEIEQLHQKQFSNYDGKSFTVYRGQGLSETDFERLQKTKGGLMSFNYFLSTSIDQNISLGYAQIGSTITDMIGIFFVISIDLSVSSTPFAAVDDISYFKIEKEILFSMHTVFRIGEIEQIDHNSRLYQVNLQLTADDDEQLRTLTKHIGNETGGNTGWKRLGNLLLKIGQLDKAEALYNTLLKQTSDDHDKVLYYNQLLHIKDEQGDYGDLVWYLQKIREIADKTLPADHLSLATSYNNIGLVDCNTDGCSKILLFYDKTSEIDEQMLRANYPSLTASSSNITGVNDHPRESSSSPSFYKKAIDIFEKTHSSNYHDLVTSDENTVGACDNTKEPVDQLSFYEKLLETRQRSLPPNHPDLAISYYNIAGMYEHVGEYSTALSFHEKAIRIFETTLPPNHPHFGASYNNIAGIYEYMGEYSKALSFHEKAIENCQKVLPTDHPHLAISYHNIAGAYEKMEEYAKALSFHEKAIRIFEKTLPPDHPRLRASYDNIGRVYQHMEEYSQALPFYEKALEIYQKTLPSDHSDLAAAYHNIGSLYTNMKEYSKALSFLEKALEICQTTLPVDRNNLAISSNNIASVYYFIGEYSKALSHFQCALDIFELSLPANHPRLESVKESIEIVKKKL